MICLILPGLEAKQVKILYNWLAVHLGPGEGIYYALPD